MIDRRHTSSKRDWTTDMCPSDPERGAAGRTLGVGLVVVDIRDGERAGGGERAILGDAAARGAVDRGGVVGAVDGDGGGLAGRIDRAWCRGGVVCAVDGGEWLIHC